MTYKHGVLYEMNLGIYFHVNNEDERSWEWSKVAILEAMDELSKEGWELVTAVSKPMADEAYILRKDWYRFEDMRRI